MGRVVDGFVNLNGTIVPADEARISLFDHGLLYGMGLFETLRGYGGRFFRLAEHLQRLRRSARRLRIELPWSNTELRDPLASVLQQNNRPDGAVRLTVTRGAGTVRPGSPAGTPFFFVTCRDWSPPPERVYAAGYTAVVSAWTQASADPLTQMKTLNFAARYLSRGEAADRGADEALLLNERGQVACASVANVFVFRGARLHSPPVGAGCLPGITRATVAALARARGWPTTWAALPLESFQSADEAFLTNSLIEVMPLVSVSGRPIGDGRPGPRTRMLLGAYRDLVRRETGG